MTRKIAFIFTYDSYLRAILPLAGYFRDRGWEAEFFLYDIGEGMKQTTKSYASGTPGLPEFTMIHDIAQFMTASNLHKFSAIFLAFGGKPLRNALGIFHDASQPLDRRPVTVSLYPGLRTPGQIEGFSARAASDIILFNNADDIEEYRACCTEAGVSAGNALLFGLPVLQGNKKISMREGKKEPVQAYYIDQAAVPKKKSGKYRLAEKLTAYAEHHKNRTLTVLLRDSQDGASAHKADLGLDSALQYLKKCRGSLPENLRMDTGSVHQVLKHADLCITISSTVALECMALGIPTALPTDFGLSAELGNTYYTGSGCQVSFDDILHDRIPAPDPAWAERHLVDIENHLPELEERLSAQTSVLRSGRKLQADSDTFEAYVQDIRKKEFARLPLYIRYGKKCYKALKYAKNVYHGRSLTKSPGRHR